MNTRTHEHENTSLRWRLAQWFEIRWWVRYLSAREPNAYLNWKRGYWHSVLSRLSEPPRGAMLDAGCGPAGVFTVLKGNKIDAIDPLLDQYDHLLAHYSREHYPNVRFSSNKIEDWRVDRSYDVIFCMNAINHVDNLQAAFHNLVQHLGPGGRLVMTVDVHRSSALKKLFRLVPGDVLHPHQLSLNDYLRLYSRHGLTTATPVKLRAGTIFDHYLVEGWKAAPTEPARDGIARQ